VVLWNVDPKDYSRPSADVVREWFRNRPFSDGDVVLFHDNHPHAMEVLPELVASARSQGISFVTIYDWLSRPKSRPEPGGTFQAVE
jgi:peptidoglycan/xylan/chitin deacetylase (PgdA/CDA1 family)